MFTNNIVSCVQGALRGKDCGGITAFLGVPFAKPPVGELRWREPQPPSRWRGVRCAEYHQAAPLQTYGGFDNGIETAYLSEDCLYLNIYTPASETDRDYPVYVWFYGGSYQGGRADDPLFCGARLAKSGVIAITVNYRVNIFGFLCHPDMRAESPYGTGGNFGLLDQIAALAWIRSNITAFGGDPDKITIGGHSAGSASVNNLLCSPMSRGLFARAINESGDVFQPERDITFDTAAELGVRLGELLSCDSLNALRALPAETFIAHNFDLVASSLHSGCTPVIDGVVIPYAQGNMLLRNDCMQVPILLGSNFDEGSGGGPGYFDRIINRLGISPDIYTDKEPDRTVMLARDYWYARHLAWARIRSERYSLPVWQYVFARHSGGRPAFHGAELPYVFKTVYDINPDIGNDEKAFTELISSYWINFIKNGDPNGEGLPVWNKKSLHSGHMRFDDRITVEGDYMRDTDEAVCPAVYKWMVRRADGDTDA